jgi:predicted RNA-binding protein
MKPIGSSAIHQKKLEALSQAGLTPDADIMIISEPCTVVPHHWRLHRPPVNYDFPPEFTEESSAPAVFDVFTDRIAEFIDSMPYTTYYPYLVAGHQTKFDAALAKAEASPRVIRIPGSSIGLESEALSGDLFKSTTDIVAKLEVIRALKDGDETVDISQYPDGIIEEYAGRSDFTVVDADGQN